MPVAQACLNQPPLSSTQRALELMDLFQNKRNRRISSDPSDEQAAPAADSGSFKLHDSISCASYGGIRKSYSSAKQKINKYINKYNFKKRG